MKSEVPSAEASLKTVEAEETMEKKSKSIIDEFLHINDYKVNT